MLFFVAFAGVNPLLVDARDPEHAREMALEEAGDETITRIEPIPPGIIVGELFAESDDDPDELVPIELLSHAVDYLERIDAMASGEAPPPPLALVPPAADTCGREGEGDGGEVVRCELAPSHDGQHEGTTDAGDLVQWSDG